MSPPAPLQDLTVVDFSQFLSGPYCSLRLLDLGARVLKVEHPDGGDPTRRLHPSDARIGEDSTLFHALNRGKDSIVLDLKSAEGHARALDLIREADVVIQNFRPGVIERLGLGYESMAALNPKVVYGSISGYGADGPWARLPGQDLLAQARSGVMWLSGDRGAGPIPIGLPVADIMAGAHLAEGILAALLRRERFGIGAHVETSLLEAMVDLQFEFLTTYLNNGRKAPRRLASGSAHGYQPAPYGLYETADGHLALAMNDLATLSEALNLPELRALSAGSGPDAGCDRRDEIHAVLVNRLKPESTDTVEVELTRRGVWCARVLSWEDLLESTAFRALDLLQSPVDAKATLVRSPLRIDGVRAEAAGLAPAHPGP